MQQKHRFQGIITALVTPFNSDGEVDEIGLRTLVRRQIEDGAMGLAVVAGSGEFVNLLASERELVVRVSVAESAGQIPTIAGVLMPNTHDAVSWSKNACKLGVDALLVLTPYYNKPSKEGIQSHFMAISDAADRPILLYNNPGRTGISLTIEEYLALSEKANIIGVKECNRDLSFLSSLISEVGSRLAILSGEDDLLFPSLSLGAAGGILTTSNIILQMWTTMYHAVSNNDFRKAKEIHYRVLPLIREVYTLNHPALVKAALSILGLPGGRTRLPLADPRPEQLERVKEVLSTLGML